MTILTLRNSNNGYTKMEKEDLEDKKRRETQFLIYKSLKKVDEIVGNSPPKSKPYWLRLRICRRLKVRIGRRLVKCRKISAFSAYDCNIATTNTTITTSSSTGHSVAVTSSSTGHSVAMTSTAANKLNVCKQFVNQFKNLRRLLSGGGCSGDAAIACHLPRPLITS